MAVQILDDHSRRRTTGFLHRRGRVVETMAQTAHKMLKGTPAAMSHGMDCGAEDAQENDQHPFAARYAIARQRLALHGPYDDFAEPDHAPHNPDIGPRRRNQISHA